MKTDFNKCSYCGKTTDLAFSWMEGAICKDCSPQWHKDHPKALSEEDTKLLGGEMSKKKVTRKYKGGGYITEEHPEPGITVLSMDGKGFYEEFGKSFIKSLKRRKHASK